MARRARSRRSILPLDLWFVLVAVVLTVVVVFAPIVRESPIRVLVGLGFVLFVPGYTFVAALFPEAGEVSSGDDEDGQGIDGLERLVLSFGTSIAVVPLVGLVLNFTPWGIRLLPVVASLTLLTVGLVAVAAVRRRQLPAEERFSVPLANWTSSARQELLSPGTRTDAALNVVLVLSLLLAIGSVTYAVGVPKQGEPFTEFFVLTENESGQLVADDYPTNFTVGEGQPVVVGVGNHERESMVYTVVTELHDVRFESGSAVVLEEEGLGRFSTRLDSGETRHHEHVVEPTMTGERLRLTYLLYVGEVPATPTVENAYRETHLWINVTDG